MLTRGEFQAKRPRDFRNGWLVEHVSTPHDHLDAGALLDAGADFLLLGAVGGVEPPIRDAVALGVLEYSLEGRRALVTDQRQGALLALYQQQPAGGEGRQQHVADFRIHLDELDDRFRRDQEDLALLDSDAVGERRLAEKQAQFTGKLSRLHDPEHQSVGIPYLQGGRNQVDEWVLVIVDPVQQFALGYQAPFAASLECRDYAVRQPCIRAPSQLLVIEIFEHCLRSLSPHAPIPDARFCSSERSRGRDRA